MILNKSPSVIYVFTLVNTANEQREGIKGGYAYQMRFLFNDMDFKSGIKICLVQITTLLKEEIFLRIIKRYCVNMRRCQNSY